MNLIHVSIVKITEMFALMGWARRRYVMRKRYDGDASVLTTPNCGQNSIVSLARLYSLIVLIQIVSFIRMVPSLSSLSMMLAKCPS